MYQKRYIEKKSAPNYTFGWFIILIIKRSTTLYQFVLHYKFLKLRLLSFTIWVQSFKWWEMGKHIICWILHQNTAFSLLDIIFTNIICPFKLLVKKTSNFSHYVKVNCKIVLLIIFFFGGGWGKITHNITLIHNNDDQPLEYTVLWYMDKSNISLKLLLEDKFIPVTNNLKTQLFIGEENFYYNLKFSQFYILWYIIFYNQPRYDHV